HLCLDALRRIDTPVVDLTGGAPEMNPDFRWFVEQIVALGRRVIDRCNLTILMVGGYRDLPEFLARHRVEIVASLPYYLDKQTDAQRGDHVFERSIEALRRLNAIGYGREGSGLILNLVYNPVGAFLPPPQAAIEADYTRELRRRYGIEFSALYTITNMPINRFLDFLIESGNYGGYMRKLAGAFNVQAARQVMCRTMLSVGWDGQLYDCDFNQMLDMPVDHGLPRHIRDFDPARLATREICTANHCFGCTAGAGSSCTGAVS
ncbi:MAG: arsenosugar biosynthesis radical SAM (seleno)protein ArsS, partial [Phycisphaerae bacterium]